MRQPIQLLRVLATMVLVAGLVALDQRASRTTAGPMTPQDTVVVQRLGLQLLDPVTGEVRWSAENPRGVSGAVTTSAGVIFASVATADGGGTDVYAIPPGGATPERIAHVPGWAIVKGLGTDGDRLHLVEFANTSAEGMIQAATGVHEVLLPERWRESAPAATARRDTGGGVLSPDARHWYRMQSTRPDGPNELPKPELLVVTFAEGAPPSEERIPIPGARGYTALLMAPDGGRLYVVDFYAQADFTVDTEQGSVRTAVEFGEHHFKRPPCAAALSPLGDILYVLGNRSNTEGDGLFAFDTASWQPVGHFLPGQGLTCLAVSPDGDRLVASASSLVTVDAQTGDEQRRVELSPIAGAMPNVVLVATTG